MGWAASGIRKKHVFLSHAGTDTEPARRLAEILRRSGVDVWFDKDDLQPGDPWMAGLEDAISHSSAMLVYIGRLGIQAWVDREVRLGLVCNTRDRNSFRFIPVLGEGADPAALPPFVQQQQYVDLRDSERSPDQIRRLIEILRNPAGEAAIPAEYWSKHSPFRSLRIFSPEDAWLFFGRDRDTDELLTRLGRAPALAVIGNSGSGKSSLIHAGLIPALRRGRFRYGGSWVDSWRTAVFRPSASPFDYLAETLPTQLAPDLGPRDRAEFLDYCKKKLPEGGEALRNAIAALVGPTGQASAKERVLLVADQFEELFTLVDNPATRVKYIDSLLAAAQLDGVIPVHLMLVMRADFYAQCLDHPSLSACLDTNLYNVPLVSPPQLRETIEKRLALAGARAEPGLIDSLLADVGAEPGNLALLEHALGQIWENCGGSGRTLTSDSYSEIGRLKGALGRHADEVLCSIEEADRELAQKIFLELVQLGEGAQDTRRRAPKEALLGLGRPEKVERLIAYLTSRRLLATSGQGPHSPAENFVEVSHEALIREWPALRSWLKENREDLRLGRILLHAAEEWRDLNRDPGALLRGARLAQGLEWLARREDPSGILREFLEASRDAEQEAQGRELRRESELRQAAEARAEAEERLRQEADNRRMADRAAALLALRSAARSRRFSYALGALFVIAAAAAWSARQQQLTAQSRALAAQAEQALSRDQPAALMLAFRGWETAKTAEANLAVAHAFPQLLGRLEGHTRSVNHTAFSPDGQRIVTSSSDDTARVWNALNGQLLVKLEGHESTVNYAEFSPDGQRIVTASGDNTARVWNAGSGQLLAKLEGHESDVNYAEFSPDGQRIVTASDDKTSRLWNAGNGQLLAKLEGHESSVNHAEFSRDGKRIVTASSDDTARVWDVVNGQLLAKLEGHKSSVDDAKFSPDSQRILTASWDKTARVWNAVTGQPLAKLVGHESSVNHAEFSPDGQRIVTASEDGTARVWNAADGRLLATLEGNMVAVAHAVFSPDGQRVLTVSSDRTVRLWNVADGRLLAQMERHAGSVEHAAFSPDGHRIVTASDDTTVQVWNVEAGARLEAPLAGHRNSVEHAAFSPDGRRIVTAGLDNRALVWNAENGEKVAELKGHVQAIGRVAFSSDGQRIATASFDNTARVWNVNGGQLLAKLEGHTDSVLDVAFSPDGQHIVTAGGSPRGPRLTAFLTTVGRKAGVTDNTARVWNAASGQLLAKLEGHTDSILHAGFSPDGQRIFTASADGTVRVWEASNGKPLAKFEAPTGGVGHAAFSRHGQRIVVFRPDGMGLVWNTANVELVTKLEGHMSGLNHVEMSPDGQRILAADSNEIQVWKAANGQLLSETHPFSIQHAEFSSDGERIVTGSLNGGIQVWNALNGLLIMKFEDAGPVGYAEFSPDGQRMVSASWDATPRLYRLITVSELAKLLRK